MDDSGTRRGKVTLRTVADATGFAVTTVSRALSGDPKIAPATRKTVAEAARRLGYVPDRAAQRLRTGRTKVITLLINPDHEFLGFLSQIQTGIVAALRGTGYSVTLMPDFIADDRIAVIENILRNRLADGIILSRTESFDPRVRLLLERGFPFVSHGRTEFTTPHPFVDFDNESFARQAVQRLVAKGRRRLMIVLPDPRFTFAQHLRYGFLSAVREAGIEHVIAEDLSLETPPAQLGAALLERQRGPNAPDGHICVGEVLGIATLSAVQDAGQMPGRDVDIVVKQASPIFELMRPRVDTIAEDLSETARKLGEMMLRRLRGEDPGALRHVIVPGGGAAQPHLSSLS
jgi:LacI family transcriptional regulator